MKRAADINDILMPLEKASSQAYLSNALQVADVLQWILRQTGPADVSMSSFSIAEEFLRRIFFMKKDALIKSLEIVLDFKATNKTLILWPFIRQVVRQCHLADNHSKIMLVENDTHRVAVVMSQNLTRGNRYESAIVTTQPDIFASLKEQFSDIVKSHSIPFHEVFAKTTGIDYTDGGTLP